MSKTKICNPFTEPKKCWWVWLIINLIIVGIAIGLGIGLGTQSEGTNNDKLFLFTLNSSGEEPFALPIIISTNPNKNNKISTSWTDYGTKMGITPLYEDGIYKTSFDNSTALKISAISLLHNSKDYNYLLLNILSAGGTYNLYNNGPSNFLKTYTEVIPQYTSNYNTSIDISLTSLQNAGYCIDQPGDHQGCIPFPG